MKAPGKQLYITVSLSCSGFSIQNYRQNSYILLLIAETGAIATAARFIKLLELSEVNYVAELTNL